MGRQLAAITVAVLSVYPAFSAAQPGKRFPIGRTLASDAMQVCRDEESRSSISAWIWGLSGAGLAAYAVTAFAGGHGSDSGLKYFAAIGAIGAGGASWNSAARRDEMAGFRRNLAGDIALSEPSPSLAPETVRKVGGEFRRMHAALITTSAGSVRAGCIMPVLLSGMSIFGFSMGSSAGADLAGISMAGALGIGGPSMLYYINIKRDLDRMDALMPRWNESFREKKKEGI